MEIKELSQISESIIKRIIKDFKSNKNIDKYHSMPNIETSITLVYEV